MTTPKPPDGTPHLSPYRCTIHFIVLALVPISLAMKPVLSVLNLLLRNATLPYVDLV